MFTVKSIVCTSLDIARAHATDLTSDEEKSPTTVQLRSFVPTAKIPLYSRKEKSTKSTDKKAEGVELMHAADFVLNEGEYSPEQISSWEEVVDWEPSHLIDSGKH